MPEALTESFCERCGTRYEFAAPTELNTIRKTRGLISGLKNYIMSQDALGDAVGDAMRSEEESLASQQLEAFHESFNFCIDCRQYTCTNCWNDGAGRCRSCVPIAGTDDLLERFEASFHAQHPELASAAAEADLDRRLGLEAWPTADLASAGGNGHGAVEWPAEELLAGAGADVVADAVAVAEPMYEPEPEPMVAEVEPEPMVAEVEPEPEPQPIVAEAEPEPMVAEAEPTSTELMVVSEVASEPIPEQYPPLHLVSWEDDATFALEPEPIVAEVEPEPEPMVAEVEPEPEPMVATVEAEAEPEPEPMVAEVEPEPEPMVAAVEAEAEPETRAPRPIRPISETILQIPRPVVQPPVAPEQDRVAAVADDASVAARRAQLDMLGLGDPGEGPVGPDRSNVLPYRSTGASVHATEVARRTAAGLEVPGAFWEASAREVAGAISHVGVQSCGDCGLSLSASARFCRRCGTRQARSA
ncbi:MAG: hypothetical protein ABJC24_10360 [Chloroflexota bacterium]